LLNFDPSRTPTLPRHAATVVVLRDGSPGIEVFCVLRHAKSSFLGGAVVFPGGKVEPADADRAWARLATAPHPRTADMSGDPDAPSALTVAVAACREMLEEAGIVPLDPPDPDPGIAGVLQRAAASHPGGLTTALEARGLRLAVDRLVPWARWVTPEAESRRFDARFFLLELPPGQVGRHDEHETTLSFWATPAAVLERAARGEIFLAPPTTRTLELLQAAPDVHAARALAGQQSLRPICPLFVPDEHAPFLALPGDPTHAVSERRVAGPTRFVLRDGRFVGEDPPGDGGSALTPPGGRDT
jgi:8-oxo-dGTP pyrophosphatase MutT (NUDIX family)